MSSVKLRSTRNRRLRIVKLRSAYLWRLFGFSSSDSFPYEHRTQAQVLRHLDSELHKLLPEVPK